MARTAAVACHPKTARGQLSEQYAMALANGSKGICTLCRYQLAPYMRVHITARRTRIFIMLLGGHPGMQCTHKMVK